MANPMAKAFLNVSQIDIVNVKQNLSAFANPKVKPMPNFLLVACCTTLSIDMESLECVALSESIPQSHHDDPADHVI